MSETKKNTTATMTNHKDFRYLLSLLYETGQTYMACEELVPMTTATAHCGDPTEMGDPGADDYVMLPKALVGMNPEIVIPVAGNSMRDAGYEPGDRLRVRLGDAVRDGDNVLALIDGACTVKTLFTDEEGQQWLVPQNEDYDAIPLRDDMNVRFVGRVVGVLKENLKPSSRAMLSAIRRTKNKQKTAQRLSQAEVNMRIVAIGEMVVHARQWYAVFRALLDYGFVADNEFTAFCQRVRSILPSHTHLPEPKELSRMAVQSFSKPVSMWEPDNAPVSGSRFRDYLAIAREMGRLLGERDDEKFPPF